MIQEQFADLVLQAQSGDKAALEQLLLQSHTPVSCLTRKILHNDPIAEQITREVLATVASNLSSLQEPAQFEQWLCRMTSARCMQSSPLLHRNFAEADKPAFWEDDLTNGSELDTEASAKAISQMVDCLPQSQRLCILLLSCGALTIPAIAQLTGFSEAIIKQNIKLGQKTIQQHLWELDSRGIRFSGDSSLTDILHDALYQDPEEEAALLMVYDILGKKLPVPLSARIIPVLTGIVMLLLMAVVVLGCLIVLKMLQSMSG